MSYLLTGAWNVIKQMQFVEEATYGVTPSSPVFQHTGPLTDMKDNYTTSDFKYRQIGSRDIYAAIKTGELYSFDIKFYPINTTLMNYGINLPNGTGTIEKSLSFLKSQKINGLEYYTLYQGCRCDKIDVEITEQAVSCTATFLAKSASTPSTTNPLTGTPTYASNPTGNPWTGLSGGTNPFTFNGNTIDTPRFKFSVTNHLVPVKPNGELFPKFVEATNREVSVDFDTWLKDTVPLADTKTLTARAATYKLQTSPSTTATFTNMYLESWNSSDSPTTNDVKMESYSGIAQAVAVA